MTNALLQSIIRKIDLRVALWAFIMFFAMDLDRGNISQANTDNFLDDLHMSTDDFNLGNTLFRVGYNLSSFEVLFINSSPLQLCFLIAELPSQLVSKKVGPDIWIPCQVLFVLLGRSIIFLTVKRRWCSGA